MGRGQGGGEGEVTWKDRWRRDMCGAKGGRVKRRREEESQSAGRVCG